MSWNGSWGIFRREIKSRIKLQAGQNIKMTVSAEDSYGNTHEATILDITADAPSARTGDEIEEYKLLDPSGRRLR